MARISDTILRIVADKRSVSDSVKAVSSVDDRMGILNKTAQKVSGSIASTGKAIKDTFSRNAPKDIDKAAAAQEKLNKKIEAGEAAIERYDQAYKKVSDRVSVYGDIDTGLATGRGLLDTVAGGAAAPLSGGLQVASEISAVAEALPRTIVGFKELAARARDASPLVQGVANQIGGPLGASLASGKAGMAAVGAAGLAAGVAVGALALTMDAYTRSAKKQAEELKAAIDASRGVSLSIADGLTTDDAQARISQIGAQLEAERSVLQQREAAYDAFEQGVSDTFGPLGGIVEAGLRAVDSNEQVLSDAVSESRRSVTELQAEFNQLQAAIDSGRLATNDAALTNEEYAQRVTEAEQSLANQREQYASTLSNLIAQELSSIENYGRQVAQTQEDRDLRASRSEEDYRAEVVKGFDRIRDIRVAGNQSIIASEVKANKALISAAEALNKSERQIQAGFVKDTLKAEKDYIKERKRAVADLNNTILEGVIDNDILAIKQAQRQAGQESAQRDEDYNEQKTQREAERDERLNELRAENILRIEELKAGLAEERQQIAASTQERITSEFAAQAERDARRAQSLSRQLQDEDIADSRRDEAHARELQRIDDQRNAAEAALNTTARAVDNLTSSAQSLVNAASRTPYRPTLDGLSQSYSAQRRIAETQNRIYGRTPTPTTPNYNPRATGPQLFAEGGVVRAGQDVIGRFEGSRDYDEAVIPLKTDTLSKLLPFNAMRPVNISYGQISISGEGVTVSEVNDAFMRFAVMQNQVIQDALQGAG